MTCSVVEEITYPKDAGSTYLQHIGACQPYYMSSQDPCNLSVHSVWVNAYIVLKLLLDI